MNNNQLLAILTIIMIILSTIIIIFYASTKTVSERIRASSIRYLLGKYSYYELIENASSIVKISLRDNPVEAYKLLLGGRILEIPVEKLESIGIHLLNNSPYAVKVGAYTVDGWVELPVRVFDEKFESPLAVVYHIPTVINNESIIQVILPDKPPVKKDSLDGEIPWFMVGSRKVSLINLKFHIGNIELEAPLYIAINNKHPYSPDYTSNILYKYVNDEYTARFNTPGLEFLDKPVIRKALTARLGLDAEEYRFLIRELYLEPIRGNYTITTLTTWGPLSGGSSGYSEYDVLETRDYAADPEYYSRIMLTRDNNSAIIPIYITDPRADIDGDNLSVSDEYLTIKAVEYYKQPVTRILEVTLMNESKTFILRGDIVNTITIHLEKHLVGLKKLGKTYPVRISINGISSDRWIVKLSSAFSFDTDKHAVNSVINKILNIQIMPVNKSIEWTIPIYNDDIHGNTMDTSYVFYIEPLPGAGYIADHGVVLKSYNITVKIDPWEYHGSTYNLEIMIGNNIVSKTIKGPGIYLYSFHNILLTPYLVRHEPIPVVVHVNVVKPGRDALLKHWEGFSISGSTGSIIFRPLIDRFLGEKGYVATSLFTDESIQWYNMAPRLIASGITGYARLIMDPSGTPILYNLYIKTIIKSLGEPLSGSGYSAYYYFEFYPFGLNTNNTFYMQNYIYREPVINLLEIQYKSKWIGVASKNEFHILQYDLGIAANWTSIGWEITPETRGNGSLGEFFTRLLSILTSNVMNYFISGYQYIEYYLLGGIAFYSNQKHSFKVLYISETGMIKPLKFEVEIASRSSLDELGGKHVYGYLWIKARLLEDKARSQSFIDGVIIVKRYVGR